MFRIGQHPPTEELNIFLNNGGLGDLVASLPAVLHAATQNTDVIVWAPSYAVEFTRTILPSNIKVMDFRDVEQRNKYSSAVQTLSATHSPMRMHLTDFASTMIVDKILDPHEKNYLKFPVNTVDLSKYELPEKFVVLTPGYTAPVREWLPNIVNDIAKFIISKEYSVVFLGTDKTLTVAKFDNGKSVEYKGHFDKGVDYTLGLNLVNKTSLNEACAIMSRAKVVVGLDNGLLHLAGCTDVPIIGGFTNVEPKHRMPYRNDVLGHNYSPIVPPASLECRFCQSNMSFVYEFDFKNCYYKDYKCTKLVDAQKYIAELDKLL